MPHYPLLISNLVRLVEDMCVHKMGAKLYQRLEGECDRHIGTMLECLVNQVRMALIYFREHYFETLTGSSLLSLSAQKDTPEIRCTVKETWEIIIITKKTKGVFNILNV